MVWTDIRWNVEDLPDTMDDGTDGESESGNSVQSARIVDNNTDDMNK